MARPKQERNKGYKSEKDVRRERVESHVGKLKTGNYTDYEISRIMWYYWKGTGIEDIALAMRRPPKGIEGLIERIFRGEKQIPRITSVEDIKYDNTVYRERERKYIQAMLDLGKPVSWFADGMGRSVSGIEKFIETTLKKEHVATLSDNFKPDLKIHGPSADRSLMLRNRIVTKFTQTLTSLSEQELEVFALNYNHLIGSVLDQIHNSIPVVGTTNET